MTTAYRYALYLCPPDPWRRFGSQWLGRCESSGLPLPRGHVADARIDDWTAAPRRYGLHATLKAPFRLWPGTRLSELDAAVRRLAQASRPFGVRLRREPLRGFLAWTIADDPQGRTHMQALADAAVADLDAFRAPPTPDEFARRRPESLPEAERAMLARWGYPYAFETYTFHITLTGTLDPAGLSDADRLFGAMGGDSLPQSMPVESVSLYVQPAPGADFVAARHYGFDGGVADAAGAGYLS